MTRCGIVTIAGKPNAGKSTLLNRFAGQKIAIVSDKPQTTRHRILGVRNAPAGQIVFIDTPGIHKPHHLLGERLVTNEFIAFIDLGKIKDQIDPHSFKIATFALCGFANFSSIAMQVGGIGALAPTRKSDLARLGLVPLDDVVRARRSCGRPVEAGLQRQVGDLGFRRRLAQRDEHHRSVGTQLGVQSGDEQVMNERTPSFRYCTLRE